MGFVFGKGVRIKKGEVLGGRHHPSDHGDSSFRMNKKG
jgi:hypothetical protein